MGGGVQHTLITPNHTGACGGNLESVCVCVRGKYHTRTEIEIHRLTVWHAKREIETLEGKYSKESIIRQENKTIQRGEREREREKERRTQREA